jgi:hypothetical protein
MRMYQLFFLGRLALESLRIYDPIQELFVIPRPHTNFILRLRQKRKHKK